MMRKASNTFSKSQNQSISQWLEEVRARRMGWKILYRRLMISKNSLRSSALKIILQCLFHKKLKLKRTEKLFQLSNKSMQLKLKLKVKRVKNQRRYKRR
jgi:hypothetical protein